MFGIKEHCKARVTKAIYKCDLLSRVPIGLVMLEEEIKFEFSFLFSRARSYSLVGETVSQAKARLSPK